MRWYTNAIVASYVSVAGVSACYAAGGGGGAGGGAGSGFSSQGPTGPTSEFLSGPQGRQHLLRAVFGYYIRYYKPEFDALHAQEKKLSFSDNDAASQGRLFKVQIKEQHLQEDMIRKLRNRDIVLAPEAAKFLENWQAS